MYLRFRRVVCFVLVLFALVCGMSAPCFGFSREDALLAISAAEDKVITCYKAISNAQDAGANVSALLDVLNEAGWFLSKAKLAYSQENFNFAVAYADNCSSRLDGFLEQTETLKLDAEQAGYWDFIVNFVGSGVGAICVVVGSSVAWVFLKRHKEARRRV